MWCWWQSGKEGEKFFKKKIEHFVHSKDELKKLKMHFTLVFITQFCTFKSTAYRAAPFLLYLTFSRRFLRNANSHLHNMRMWTKVKESRKFFLLRSSTEFDIIFTIEKRCNPLPQFTSTTLTIILILIAFKDFLIIFCFSSQEAKKRFLDIHSGKWENMTKEQQAAKKGED